MDQLNNQSHNRSTTSFRPGYGHSPTNKKRARAAAEALLKFATDEGRIPTERIPEAIKCARMATGLNWTTEHVRTLGHQIRLLPNPRQ